ncbi:MAG: HAD family phosphatase [Lachnospiraceae bacterium]|nr:HAD family phosphatase [Lachnospiraceae bacterium]
MAGDIRLIMSDLDGTLLDDDNKLTEDNIKALKRAREAGISIVPVSARFLSAIEQALEGFDEVDYVVCCNGASLYDYKTKECLFMDEMDKDTVLRMLEYFDTLQCMQFVVANGECFADQVSYDKHFHNMFIPIAYRQTTLSSTFVPSIKDIVRDDAYRVEIIFVILPDVETTNRANEVISAMGDFSTLGAFPTDLEISNASANKEHMILRMKEIVGVGAKEIMAFGDGANDAGMVGNAGIGVAMENAMEETKKTAAYITKKNTESGVGYMINRYLDGELTEDH